MRAFLYLISHSARNRFLFQLKRARNPRYGAALVVAGFYIWAFLVRPTRVGLGDIFLTRTSETIAALLMVITLSGTWVFGSDRLALSFTQAELSMLFPAPLTRRQLIGYKLYRAQIAVLINSLIWVFVLRRGGTALSAPLRAVSIWIVFSTLNLHRLGAALVRASFFEHGRVGARRNLLSILFFSAVVISLLAGAFIYRQELINAPDTGAFFISLSHVFSRPPASYGLLPFELVIRPTFARNAAVWAKAIGPAVAMLVAHIVWVMINDTAFEDAAIEASAQRARRLEAFRNRRSVGQVVAPKAAKASLRLSAVGHPALAIFWKNILCLRRTAEWRVIIAPVVMALVIGSAASNAAHEPAKFITVAALVLALMLLTFAGRMIRNDLRHDMLNLPLLKTLPISGRDLVLAEVASSALPVSALQLILLLIAFVSSLWVYEVPIPMGIRVGLLIASPFAILSLNAALLTMQNGLAVLFPAWMRLGSVVNSGVEALGQNLIATMANLLSLAFALIIPLVVAFIAVRYFMLSGALATAVVAIFTSVALAGETYAVISYLGKAISKAEPQSSAIA